MCTVYVRVRVRVFRPAFCWEMRDRIRACLYFGEESHFFLEERNEESRRARPLLKSVSSGRDICARVKLDPKDLYNALSLHRIF